MKKIAIRFLLLFGNMLFGAKIFNVKASVAVSKNGVGALKVMSFHSILFPIIIPISILI